MAREGEIGVGDAIHFLSRDESRVSVAGMRRAAGVAALPESWRSYFIERAGKSGE